MSDNWVTSTSLVTICNKSDNFEINIEEKNWIIYLTRKLKYVCYIIILDFLIFLYEKYSSSYVIIHLVVCCACHWC